MHGLSQWLVGHRRVCDAVSAFRLIDADLAAKRVVEILSKAGMVAWSNEIEGTGFFEVREVLSPGLLACVELNGIRNDHLPRAFPFGAGHDLLAKAVVKRARINCAAAVGFPLAGLDPVDEFPAAEVVCQDVVILDRGLRIRRVRDGGDPAQGVVLVVGGEAVELRGRGHDGKAEVIRSRHQECRRSCMNMLLDRKRVEGAVIDEFTVMTGFAGV